MSSPRSVSHFSKAPERFSLVLQPPSSSQRLGEGRRAPLLPVPQPFQSHLSPQASSHALLLSTAPQQELLISCAAPMDSHHHTKHRWLVGIQSLRTPSASSPAAANHSPLPSSLTPSGSGSCLASPSRACMAEVFPSAPSLPVVQAERARSPSPPRDRSPFPFSGAPPPLPMPEPPPQVPASVHLLDPIAKPTAAPVPIVEQQEKCQMQRQQRPGIRLEFIIFCVIMACLEPKCAPYLAGLVVLLHAAGLGSKQGP